MDTPRPSPRTNRTRRVPHPASDLAGLLLANENIAWLNLTWNNVGPPGKRALAKAARTRRVRKVREENEAKAIAQREEEERCDPTSD